jgi:hypothetical protein
LWAGCNFEKKSAFMKNDLILAGMVKILCYRMDG